MSVKHLVIRQAGLGLSTDAWRIPPGSCWSTSGPSLALRRLAISRLSGTKRH
jgi:hypothetical protein